MSGWGQTTTGLEMLQTQVLVQIIENLPAELDRQAAAWDPVDASIAARTQTPYAKTILEKPKKSSYFGGSRLGVITLPWDDFPAVAVMADSASPTIESAQHDQAMHVFATSFYIEAVIRSDEFKRDDARARVEQEGLIDRRTKRTIEALVQCISLDPSLGGVAVDLPAPQVSQTDAFLLDGTQPENMMLARVFSMLRIQYSSDVYATLRNAASLAPMVLPAGFGS